MSENQITISWEKRSPEATGQVQVPEMQRLEDYFDYAFRQNWSRFQSWNFKAGDQLAEIAASYFKRGTPREDESSEQGSYAINFIQTLRFFAGAQNDDHLYFVDENVFDAWPELKQLKAPYLTLSVNEAGKIFTTAREIRDEILRSNAKAVAVIGGGVLSDTVGFAAAMADVPLHLYPTTLLAMADASVGGKTGVNYPPFGKNQIGAFYFPSSVTIWPGWLKTLPIREFQSGLIECIKHGLIADRWDLIEEAKELSYAKITLPWLKEIVQVKANIVKEDATEQAGRAKLNLGHTLGHALEAYALKNRLTLLHGEAVGLGIMFVNHLSWSRGMITENRFRQIENSITTQPEFELPRSIDALKTFLRQDKKSGWVLFEKDGVGCGYRVIEQELENSWAYILRRYCPPTS